MRFGNRSNPNLSEEEYKELEGMLEECETNAELFNDWEEKFLTEMREKIIGRQFMSVGQRDVMSTLYEKVVRRNR